MLTGDIAKFNGKADAEPVLGALGVDADHGRIRLGVVDADLFDDAAVALLAGIDDDDAVGGGVDLAHALEADSNCHLSGLSYFQIGVGLGPPRWEHGSGVGPGHGWAR